MKRESLDRYFPSFAAQFSRDPNWRKERQQGQTAREAFDLWCRRRMGLVSAALDEHRAGARGKAQPWRSRTWQKGELLDNGGTHYRARTATSVPPWKNARLWERVA